MDLVGRLRLRAKGKAQGHKELRSGSEDELAFWVAPQRNDRVMRVLCDETLRDITRQLVETFGNNVTIDWTRRNNVWANIWRLVRRSLRECGCPPNKRQKTTQTVLVQPEVLSQGCAVA